MNSYTLSRNWFDWCFENPEKINPNHSALYFFCIEHCNRLGWKDKFGLPTSMAKEAIGIKNFRTYRNTLNDLVAFGFIKMIEVSKNQYSSNIIAIVKNTKAHTKALDKALQKHDATHCITIDSIDKPNNNKPNNSERTLENVKLYFLQNGYTEASAIKAFNFYDCADWKDSNGKKVINWKQKMQSVWFKPENKIVESKYFIKPDGTIDYYRNADGSLKRVF